MLLRKVTRIGEAFLLRRGNTMTVTELIEKLQEFPEDMDVIVEIEAFKFADVTVVT